MSSLKILRDLLVEAIDEKAGMSSMDIIDYVDGYIAEEQKKYDINKANKALTFGKYKGFTVKELSSTPKGRDYLSWLRRQQWCTPQKFPYIHNIKKNIE